MRVRQPLASLDARPLPTRMQLRAYAALVASESSTSSAWSGSPSSSSSATNPVERRLTVNARAAGPRIGKSVQQAIAGSKSGDWSEADGVVTSGGIALEAGRVRARDRHRRGAATAWRPRRCLPGGGFVALDTALTPELEAEGYARDLIRAIQDQRKAEGLNVGDRITLVLTVPAGPRGRGRGAPASSSRTRCSRRRSPWRQGTRKRSRCPRHSESPHRAPCPARACTQEWLSRWRANAGGALAWTAARALGNNRRHAYEPT